MIVCLTMEVAQAQLPDLEPIDIQGPPSAVIGETINVTWEVLNRGDAVAQGNWGDDLRLSRGTTRFDWFVFLGTVYHQDAVAVQGTYRTNLQAQIPDVTPGSYYLLLITHWRGDLDELTFTNNYLARPIEIRGPDLVPIQLEAPATIGLGQPFEVSWAVTNRGTADAAGQWSDQLYLSTNNILDGQDHYIGQWTWTNGLPTEQTYQSMATTELTQTLAPGDYHLLLFVNRDGALREITGTNNLISRPVYLAEEEAFEMSTGSGLMGIRLSQLHYNPPEETDRLEISFNGEYMGTAYGPDFSVFMNPFFLMRFDGSALDEARIEARAISAEDQVVGISVTDHFSELSEGFPTQVEIIEPRREYRIYSTGGPSPLHTMVIRVEALRLGPLWEGPGASTIHVQGETQPQDLADVDEAWLPTAPVKFYVDGDLIHTSTNVPSEEYPYHEFEYTSQGLALGSHQLYVVVEPAEGLYGSSASRTFYVEVAQPAFNWSRHVYPQDNHFHVVVDIYNHGAGGASLLRFVEPMTGFQACNVTSTLPFVSLSTPFSYAEKRSQLTFDYGGAWLASETTCTITFDAVPILLPADCDYAFGGNEGLLEFQDPYGSQETEDWDQINTRTDPWALREDIDDVVVDMLAASDYLAITDPVNLLEACGSTDGSGVLTDMAELTVLRNGVLGYYHTIGIIQTLFRTGAFIGMGNVVRHRDVPEQLVLGLPDEDFLRIHFDDHEVRLADGHMPLAVDLRPGDAMAVGNVRPTDSDSNVHPRNEIIVARGEARDGYAEGRISVYMYEYDPGPTGAEQFVEDQQSSDFVTGGRLATGEAKFVPAADDQDEIIIANPDGEVLICQGFGGTLLSSFTIESGTADPFAVGNLYGNERVEMVAGNTATDELLIYAHDGPDWQVFSDPDYICAHRFAHALEPGDGLAVGDVWGDGYEEIILADESDDEIVVIGYQPGTASFDVVDRFDLDFTDGDQLAAGYLASKQKEQIIVLRGDDWFGRQAGMVEMITLTGGQQPGDRWALDALINTGGFWAEQLQSNWVNEGYLMIVGENEIVPTFSKTWNLEDCDGGRVDYTDRNYASTDSSSDNNVPELAVGRIPGNSAERLRHGLRYAIETVENLDALRDTYAYVLSGSDNSDPTRFVSRRDQLADLLSGAGFSVTEDHIPSVATFAANATEKDIICFVGHGSAWGCCDIGGGDISAQFNPSYKRPFVCAMSCLTGRYPSGRTFGERFIEKGASGYMGATEVSFGYYNDMLGEAFFGRLMPGLSIARSLTWAKQTRLTEDSNPDDENWNANRYHCGIYHFLGDPKLEITFDDAELTSMSAGDGGGQQGNPIPGPVAELEIQVPPYEVNAHGDVHVVRIPGQDQFFRVGRATVPFYSETIHFPKGYVVQDVALQHRDGLVTDSGLNLPPATLTQDGPGGESAPQDNGSGWWPERDFAWSVAQNPDGSSTLAIKAFPFYYQRDTQEARFYTNYTFGIDYIESTLEIRALAADRKVYPLGGLVNLDLAVQHTNAEPMTVDVAAVVLANDTDPVAQLATRRLANLKGLGWCRLSWDSTGYPGDEYVMRVDVRDESGALLDREQALFVVGGTTGAITDFSMEPRSYQLGEDVQLSATFTYSGAATTEGAVILEVYDAAGNLETTFRGEFTDLPGGASYTFDTTWSGASLVPRNCRVLAYAEFEGQITSRVAVANWANAPLRCDGVVVTEDGIHLYWPTVPGRSYNIEFTPDLASPFEVIASDVSSTPPQGEFIDSVDRTQGFYRVREDIRPQP